MSVLGLYFRPVLAKEGETQKKRMKVKRDGGIIRKRRNGGMCSKKREKEQLVDRVDVEKSNYFEPIKRMRKSQHGWGWKSSENSGGVKEENKLVYIKCQTTICQIKKKKERSNHTYFIFEYIHSEIKKLLLVIY